jgi:glycosyltransferase involved in cell wall biosynthesis
MRDADAIHVRCPGNLGLLGAILAPCFSRFVVAKYAGQWNGYHGEPWTIGLQRRVLRSRWWRGPVTVYGDWPDQPRHVVPFFTSMMSAAQVERAADVALHKRIGRPLRVLYCGTLTPRKCVDVLVDALGMLRSRGVPIELAVVGGGPQRAALEQQVARLGLSDAVRFAGPLAFDHAITWYSWAHCLVLPSRHSEGWPKVVAEAMCHGVLCVAVAHGHVPAMLAGRGICLPTGTADEIAGALEEVARDPDAYAPVIRAAGDWARQFSLEGLRDALAALLDRHWWHSDQLLPRPS